MHSVEYNDAAMSYVYLLSESPVAKTFGITALASIQHPLDKQKTCNPKYAVQM